MAKHDQILRLLRSALDRDVVTVAAIGKCIQADLEKANRHASAKQVDRILSSRNMQMISLAQQTDKFIWWEQPDRTLDSVRLTMENEDLVKSIIRDNKESICLSENGLMPRNKVMLDGPSGTGKTSLARAFARELNRPLGIVRMGQVIDSHLGCTGQNLDQMMERLPLPCVLLFDEWDSVASQRDDHDSAASKENDRITCALLTLLERLPSTCLLLTATNLPERCDQAFLRRFDERISLPIPDTTELYFFTDGFRNPWRHLGININKLDLGTTYATAERAVLNASRRAVLDRIKLKGDDSSEPVRGETTPLLTSREGLQPQLTSPPQ